MRYLVVFTILTLVFAATVFAGEPESGQFNVTVGGGINMPSGEEAKNGFVLGAGLGYHATSHLVLGAEISYLGYSKEEGTLENLGNPIDYSVSQHFFSYMGTARFFTNTNKTSPYFKGFAGRFNYSLNSTFGGEPIDHSYSDLQYGGGIGMIVRGERESNFFIEALYHRLEVEEDTGELFTLTVGMDFSFSP